MHMNVNVKPEAVAYREGELAYQEGKLETNCPYPLTSWLSRFWISGYQSAKDFDIKFDELEEQPFEQYN